MNSSSCGQQNSITRLSNNVTTVNSSLVAESSQYKGSKISNPQVNSRSPQVFLATSPFLGKDKIWIDESSQQLAEDFRQQEKQRRDKFVTMQKKVVPLQRTGNYPIYQPPMIMQPMIIPQQRFPILAHSPTAQQVIQQKLLEKKKIESLDDIRVTDADKDKIRQIIENPDQKWQQSNFVNFLKEVQHKESIQAPIENQGLRWVDEYAKLKQEEPEWANQLEELKQSGIDWEKELNVDWENYKKDLRSFTNTNKETGYIFQEKNPYEQKLDPFEEGLKLMKDGNLTEAVKAFEAACKYDSTRAIAWRFLGKCSADNENEQNAIAAFHNCLEHDPYDLESLLQLGVSYTNDLKQQEALTFLRRWIENHPDYSQSVKKIVPKKNMDKFYIGSKENQETVIEMFHQASQLQPSDHQVHTVLGVLYNLTCEYDKAIYHFKHAIMKEPKDPSLWNKLGATQANGEYSEASIESYTQALKLKPNYTRALSNLGIGFSNLSKYREAIQTYLACLTFNPNADNVWDHLSIALHQYGKRDLVPLVDQKNVRLFRPYFDF